MIEYTFPRGMSDLRTGDLPRINDLIAVLTQRAVTCGRDELATVFYRAQLLLARDIAVEGEAPIVGMGTMNLVSVTYACSGLIDDVVVLPSHQGRGIGTAIVERLIAQARNLGLAYVELSSTPQRAAANHVYAQKLKGKRRDTNVYRWTFWSNDHRAG